MRDFGLIPLALFAWAAGCAFLAGPPAVAPCWSEFHSHGFDAHGFGRVLLLPLANESPFPQAADEMRRALATELQCLGAFEVLVPPPCPEYCTAQLMRVQGRFNEAAMIELMHNHRVDGVIFGAVTQYQPYAPPRIGLSLQMVSPAQAVVVASVDGLWDARHKEIAEQVRDYYGHEGRWLRGVPPSDLALASPQLYQRFVCHQAALVLTRIPPPPPAQDHPAPQPANANPNTANKPSQKTTDRPAGEAAASASPAP
jgi:hypothetical protein